MECYDPLVTSQLATSHFAGRASLGIETRTHHASRGPGRSAVSRTRPPVRSRHFHPNFVTTAARLPTLSAPLSPRCRRARPVEPARRGPRRGRRLAPPVPGLRCGPRRAPRRRRRAVGRVARQPKFAADPFALGVASGDPTDTGVVLWTRLAPKPLDEAGGMPPENVEVRWEVADDEAMKAVLKSGTAVATPQLGHSVHVEVEGLKPDRWYFYRFRAATRPAPSAAPAPRPSRPRRPTSCGSRSRPASTTSRGCSPPTSTWRRTTSTSSSTSATTSTSTRASRSGSASTPARRRPRFRRSTTTATVTPSTAPTRCSGDARPLPVGRHVGRP